MHTDNRVLVAMSGGVDSAAAALLLLRAGYEVAGATFRLWDELGNGAARDAAQVCQTLGIAHRVLDYREPFRRRVVDYFAAEYRRGATPNPCVACNRHIKFGAFLETAQSLGFPHIATGHYARVAAGDGRYRLRRAAHLPKDQSYVLYTLGQQVLSRLLLPLGEYTKAQVRDLAGAAGLAVGGKAESQDICFIPDGDYAAFLERYTGESAPAGSFVDGDGRRLGDHRGLWRYTVGQRKGLGQGFGRPLYVAGLDPATGSVTLADNAALFRRELIGDDAVYAGGAPPAAPFRCEAKIRYAARPAPATATPLPGGAVRVAFDEPQRAPAPGQAVVLYDGEYVLGGATITGGN